VNTEQLQNCIQRRDTICFRHIIVNTLHKVDNKNDDDNDNDNNNNNNNNNSVILRCAIPVVCLNYMVR